MFFPPDFLSIERIEALDRRVRAKISCAGNSENSLYQPKPLLLPIQPFNQINNQFVVDPDLGTKKQVHASRQFFFVKSQEHYSFYAQKIRH